MPQLLCPACKATNRLPDGKNPKAAKCGRCGTPLFAGRPRDVSYAELQAHLSATRGLAILLDVWAPWCGPCRAMAPHFAAAAAQLEPLVLLLKLNSEAEPRAAADLRVSGIPALILFREGREIARHAGAMSGEGVIAWTQEALASQAV